MKSMCHDPRRNSPWVAGLQADTLLQRDGSADRVVLGGAQLSGADAPSGTLRSRVRQLRRAQQAADMIGAKRGNGSGLSWADLLSVSVIKKQHAAQVASIQRMSW